ncbi:hypothetical protein EHQ76_18245 [Leptospira barantonii]|uniref:Uncharacterized protein n=1 Tax=Leptospira barantonii TaxID=2023184 RepID=A0A5F2AYR0_9LEPT|nr:hypothetical protein EHQ76_18245 [Leptospira barantonii]
MNRNASFTSIFFEFQTEPFVLCELKAFPKKCQENCHRSKLLLQLLLKKVFIVDLCFGRN